jgi:hypothetical protein
VNTDNANTDTDKVKFSIGEKLGRIFEIGFNAGLLQDLARRELCPKLVEQYRSDLDKLNLNQVVRRLIESEGILLSSPDQALLEKWVVYYLGRGFLSGQVFLGEYLAASGWNNSKKIEVLYYQANFAGDNSFGLNSKSPDQFAAQMLSQFGLELEAVDWQKYCKKGEFLKADTILLLSYRSKHFRLLTLDLSIFAVRQMTDLADLEDVEMLRRQLIGELNYVKSKSVFADLSLDTGGFNLSADLVTYFTAFKRKDKETSKLIQAASYAHSFLNFLKEYDLLENANVPPTVNVVGYSDRGMSALTLTPQNYKVLETCAKIYKENSGREAITDARHKVLKFTQRSAAHSFVGGRDFLRRLMAVPTGELSKVVHTEQIEGFMSTESYLDATALQKLGIKPTSPFEDDSGSPATGQEWVRERMSLRNAHAALIRQALTNQQENFIFLTGNPGIGKTTAVIEFLKKCIEEGFLFLYVSPRNQVNFDVIHKFQEREGEEQRLCNDRLLGLNTNSNIIRANGGLSTVQYVSNRLHGRHQYGAVTFLDDININNELLEPPTDPDLHYEIENVAVSENGVNADNSATDIAYHENEEGISNSPSATRTGSPPTNTPVSGSQFDFTGSGSGGRGGMKRIFDDVLQESEEANAGVLNTICEAIYAAINYNVSDNVIATASIQSLKRTQQGEDTLKHFGKIFKGAYNEREARVLPNKMRELAGRIKHLFIMVDEITGDDSGVAFLNRLVELLEKYELLEGKHGFNTKVIVADASIVEATVISRHLEENNKEDSTEPDKIFFRRLSSASVQNGSQEQDGNQTIEVVPAESALSKTTFNFGHYQATLINANSYPASRLDITYKVFVDSYRAGSDNLPPALPPKNFGLTNTMQATLLEDINNLLNQPDTGQILVYVQDKRRLRELIGRLEKLRKTKGFELNTDYLTVHADLNSAEKKHVQALTNEVKVVFMTASASRGLSFPKTTHILIDVPRFDVEKNLMEIIQVIYRGRGSFYDTKTGRSVTFDNKPRDLTFYLGERIPYYTNEEVGAETSLQEGLLNLVNILLVLKTSIMTRIQGYGKVGHDRYMMIPIGGKAVSAAGESFANRMTTLVRELEKHQQLGRHNDRLLKELYGKLRKLLSNGEFRLSQVETSSNQKPKKPQQQRQQDQEVEVRSFLSLVSQFDREFRQLVQQSFGKLLDFKGVEAGYIQGSLLIVPIRDKQLETNYLLRLVHELEPWFNDRALRAKLYEVMRDTSYPEALRLALRDAGRFIGQLRQQQDKTQWFVERTRRSDLYYAIPLFTLVSSQALAKYYADNPQEPEDTTFKELLASYTQTLFSIDGLLPVGTRYGKFPFVVFRSYSLPEMRRKAFTDKYLLTSRELNILNLLLAQND